MPRASKVAKPTDEEKVAQFYYNLNRFTESMKNYEQYLKTKNICANRMKIAEANDMGLRREDQAAEKAKLGQFISKSDALVNSEMKTAIECFQNMKKLLS